MLNTYLKFKKYTKFFELIKQMKEKEVKMDEKTNHVIFRTHCRISYSLDEIMNDFKNIPHTETNYCILLLGVIKLNSLETLSDTLKMMEKDKISQSSQNVNKILDSCLKKGFIPHHKYLKEYFEE
jgi:pentatricopeptide repeat protein